MPDQATTSPVTGYRSVTEISSLSPLRACARDSVNTHKRGNQPVTGNRPAPTTNVTILKHCRCADCRLFRRVGNDFICDAGIGGTAVVWATGRRFCEPAPDAWQYCAGYDGPQIGDDVWVWPKATESSENQRDTPPCEALREGDLSNV